MVLVLEVVIVVVASVKSMSHKKQLCVDHFVTWLLCFGICDQLSINIVQDDKNQLCVCYSSHFFTVFWDLLIVERAWFLLVEVCLMYANDTRLLERDIDNI